MAVILKAICQFIIKKDCKDITGTTCSYKYNTSGLVYNIPSLFLARKVPIYR